MWYQYYIQTIPIPGLASNLIPILCSYGTNIRFKWYQVYVQVIKILDCGDTKIKFL